jgi:hypothetical protein
VKTCEPALQDAADAVFCWLNFSSANKHNASILRSPFPPPFEGADGIAQMRAGLYEGEARFLDKTLLDAAT